MAYACSQTGGKRGEGGGVPHPPQAPTSAERVPLPLRARLRAPFYGPVESGRSCNAPVLGFPVPGRRRGGRGCRACRGCGCPSREQSGCPELASPPLSPKICLHNGVED